MIGWLFGSRRERHDIDGGEVLCPRFGSVDVERCLRCSEILAVVRDGDPHIRCTGIDRVEPDPLPLPSL